MQAEIVIDDYGYVNGIDPTDWQGLMANNLHLGEVERRTALTRWHDPALIAQRQGMLPVLDIRDPWVIAEERRAERRDFQ